MLLRESSPGEVSFANLMPFSSSEVGSVPLAARQFILEHSSPIWQLEENGTVFMATGIYHPTLIGHAPELWFLLYNSAETHMFETLRNIHALARMLHRHFPGLQIHVARAFEAGNKFAVLMGFAFVKEAGAFNQYRGVK